MNGSYLDQLNLALTNHLANKITLPRVAIIGIGNELNGDDGAGLLAIRVLGQFINSSDCILLLEGSISPENYTSTIRKFQPDWIWYFDAAELGCGAGEIHLLEPADFTGLSASTHAMPLSMLVDFLQKETRALTFFFGIQPQAIVPFTEMSPLVSRMVSKSCSQLGVWLRDKFNLF